MVARNFRSPQCRGEIDLIGGEKGVLCFVEVKTRSNRDMKTGVAAVDRHKRREIAAVVARVSAPASTFVPVAFRGGQRILRPFASQPAAD